MKRLFVVLLMLFSITSGCSSYAKMHIVAPTIDYPVSTTSEILDTDGHILTTDKDLEVIEAFSFSIFHWYIGRTQLSSYEHNISDELNNAIRSRHGDAAVNIKLSINAEWGYEILLPFIPTVAIASISGEVVRK